MFISLPQTGSNENLQWVNRLWVFARARRLRQCTAVGSGTSWGQQAHRRPSLRWLLTTQSLFGGERKKTNRCVCSPLGPTISDNLVEAATSRRSPEAWRGGDPWSEVGRAGVWCAAGFQETELWYGRFEAGGETSIRFTGGEQLWLMRPAYRWHAPSKPHQQTSLHEAGICGLVLFKTLRTGTPPLWRSRCFISVLICHTPSSGGIVLEKEKCLQTQILTNLCSESERTRPFVCNEKVLYLLFQLVKNGRECCFFVFLCV